MGAPEEKTVEAIDLGRLLIARAYLYTLMSKLTGAEPCAATLDALFGREAAEAVACYASDDETMAGLGRFLEQRSHCEDRELLLESACDEFTRLFIGPDRLPALPFESPYLSNDPTCFQEGTVAVREVYRASSLEPRRVQRVPDDHVALETAYLSRLGGDAVDALLAGADPVGLAESLRKQQRFLHEHLNVWVGEFARRERASRTAVLYPQLIEALAALAAIDEVFCGEAAYWAEQQEDAFAFDRNAVAETLRSECEALRSVASLRPVGIEEYELVSLQDARA